MACRTLRMVWAKFNYHLMQPPRTPPHLFLTLASRLSTHPPALSLARTPYSEGHDTRFNVLLRGVVLLHQAVLCTVIIQINAKVFAAFDAANVYLIQCTFSEWRKKSPPDKSPPFFKGHDHRGQNPTENRLGRTQPHLYCPPFL